MRKIIFYYLSFRPQGHGRVIFRLEGEPTNRMVDLPPSDFSALAAVLAQKQISYSVERETFVSFDDDHLPVINENLIA